MEQILEKIKEKFFKEKYSVGLDLGKSAVKAVKLKITGANLELCGFSFEPAQEDMSTVFRKILYEQAVKRVNIAVSGASVVLRYMNFPEMKDEEFAQSFKFEAEKNIPFPIAEVNLDGYILKHGFSENQMFILIAAAKKDFIKERLALIENNGFFVKAVCIDSLALINAFNFNYSDEPDLKEKAVAILNIGTQLSNLNILIDAIPYLSRDISVAGNNFTQKFAEVLEVGFNEAELIKLKPDGQVLDKMGAAIDTVLTSLANEIRRSFDYYESQSASSIAKIFLSGGGSLLPGLKDKLAELLGIEVEGWDPLKKITIAANIDKEKLSRLSPQLAVAVGLALHKG